MNAIEQWKANGTPYNEGVLLYASLPTHNKVLLKKLPKKAIATTSGKIEI
ncbi:MAG: hypothetical protein LRY25_00335 [Flavobacterium sp.]|nr:hypothetical protein [Flavobacterium sp.]